MKSVLLATAVCLTASGGAFAADPRVLQKEPDAIAQSDYSWSGIYVGAAVGYQNVRASDITYGGGAENDGGFAGSIYGGYNYQYTNWVFGVEGDLGFSGAQLDDGSFLRPLETRIAGSLRGRLGYAIDDVMPYLTGGLAIGRFRADHNGASNPDGFATETLNGYAIGGGIDWGATQNLIVRAEYMYSDYGTNDFLFGGSDIHEVDVITHDVRVGIAYKF